VKIIIIEDERNTADDLERTILRVEPRAEIMAKLHSVKEALIYFSEHGGPDLMFCDIQLGDGTSFEIISKADLKVPTIFCTAFDEFALHAFETYSIDYILKPFDDIMVAKAIDKFSGLKKILNPVNREMILEMLDKRSRGEDRMLVRFKDKILPVAFSEIALCYLEHELTQLVTFDGRSYIIQKSLEELEKQLGMSFYRVNRQYLVNKNAIKDLTTGLTRIVTVNLKFPFGNRITVSKVKAGGFLDWLTVTS
jgi:two-component system response regulator LytT